MPPNEPPENPAEPPPLPDQTTAYARAVVAGEIVAGPYVRAACARHLRDLEEGGARGLRFDVKSAERAIGFFRDVLTIEIEAQNDFGEVESRAAPFLLQPWQAFIVGSIFGWKNAGGIRRFRRAFCEIAKGSGKALALSTPIPTPSGWRDMRALQVGDIVFDEAGKPCRVIGTTPAMTGRPCYRVTFSDGAQIIADEDHLWVTTALRSGGAMGPKPASAPRKNTPSIKTTREIAATLRMKPSTSKHPQAKWNHRVDIAGALELPEVDLPIPPYTLGVWLGDGDSDSARITVAVKDWEIVEAIQSDGVPVIEQSRHAPHIARVSLSAGHGVRHDGLPASILSIAAGLPTVTAPSLAQATGRDRDRVAEFVSGSGFFEQIAPRRGLGDGGGTVAAVWRLREDRRDAAVAASSREPAISVMLARLDLLNNKHIPAVYLRASKAQRLALLQGLMDSDGHASKDNGGCELCFTNKALADGALELIRSLGIKTKLATSDAKLYGRVVGLRYRIQFFSPAELNVFRLKRKLIQVRAVPKTRRLSSGRMIVGCDPIASVPVKCISVDSPARMYLAGREMVPTHNSPMAAGIGHYMLLGTRKLRAEVYSAATDKDQAAILFRDAVAMWERSRALRRRLVSKGSKPVWELRTVQRGMNGFFKPISSDKKGKSGIRPYCALIDEVHEHPDNSVIEMLRAGTKGNQEALQFEITNSGFDKKSVCGQEHDYSVEVVTGVKDNDAFFVYIAALDDGDEPFEDEACWIKANPNLGVSIYHEYIREQVQEARGMPSKEGLVRRLHFCQWTGSDSSAIPRITWMQCQAVGDKVFDPNDLTRREIPCYGGLDISRVRDLTAFTLTWLLEAKQDQWRFASKTWFWTPKDTLKERSKTDRAPYELWVEQGYLEAVPGPRIKYSWLANALLALNAKYHPVQIGCDQYGLEQLQEALDAAGGSLPAVVHPQGFQRRVIGERGEKEEGSETGADEIVLWMPDSINKLEAALLEQRMVVAVNPVMTSCAASVVYAENRSGHRMFDKSKATHRIDGMASLAMSVGMATAAFVPSDAGVLDQWLGIAGPASRLEGR